MKPIEFSGKEEKVTERKEMNFKQPVRTKVLETIIGA
jgi:hypothetical protein